MRKIGLAIFLMAALASSSASALNLGEHRRITDEAVREFNLCFPGSITENENRSLDYSNLYEDLFLPRKWWKYSHFYHPGKKLLTRRVPSDARVLVLVSDLADGRSQQNSYKGRRKMISSIGAILHHVQDAACPVHVVPVMHSFGEPYEKFQLTEKEFPKHDPTAEDCAALAATPSSDAMEVLRDTALSTLQRVGSPLEYNVDGELAVSSWADFWKVATGDGFGDYGAFGKHYGETRFTSGNHVIEIPAETYRAFRVEQTRLAIEATLKELLWLKKPN